MSSSESFREMSRINHVFTRIFSEPIVACDVTKPANNAVLRIMGTRIGFRDDGQREYLVKLRGLEA